MFMKTFLASSLGAASLFSAAHSAEFMEFKFPIAAYDASQGATVSTVDLTSLLSANNAIQAFIWVSYAEGAYQSEYLGFTERWAFVHEEDMGYERTYYYNYDLFNHYGDLTQDGVQISLNGSSFEAVTSYQGSWGDDWVEYYEYQVPIEPNENPYGGPDYYFVMANIWNSHGEGYHGMMDPGTGLTLSAADLSALNLDKMLSVNISGQGQTSYLELYLGVYYEPLQAAVPEPATWAFMIGGLALTGAMMRRRRPVPPFAC